MTDIARSRLLWPLAGLILLACVSGRSIPGVMIGDNVKLSDANPHRKLLEEDSSPTEAGVEPATSAKSFFDRVGIYIVSFGCTITLIVIISVLAVLYLRRKRRMAAVSPYWRQGMSGQLQTAFETSVPVLSRDEVETACEDFSNIIGSSPGSVVYKGTLANGTEIAALSLETPSMWNPQSEMWFRSSVKSLGRMQHPHLVNLIGYCSQEQPWTRIFVFEYAGNGTLYDHLHKDNKDGEHLNWAARMRVIVGVALGLQYMHHELTPPTSHVSFGADAVYLTDDFAAKVSNAGATKLPFVGTQPPKRRRSFFSHIKSVAGDHDEGELSSEVGFESNVYSFGVFLLEVITGRVREDEQGASIVDWAAEYLGDAKMMWYMVDPSLKTYKHDELVGLCGVVNMCLGPEAERPSMGRAAEMVAEVVRLTPEMVAAKSTAALWAQLELQDDTASELST